MLTRARVAPRLARVLVAPVTTTVRGLATEVAMGTPEGVRDGSVANLDNIQLVPVSLLLRRAGTIAAPRCPSLARVLSGYGQSNGLPGLDAWPPVSSKGGQRHACPTPGLSRTSPGAPPPTLKARARCPTRPSAPGPRRYR
ncbi:MAG: hypothetical protein ACRDWV_07450 [Acidimicrobiales bacterium]